MKNQTLLHYAARIGEKQPMQCSYAIHGRDHIRQAWFHCKTCGLEGDYGFCKSCSKVCHQGHKVEYAGVSSLCYCDCGAGSGKTPCKCLKSSSKTISPNNLTEIVELLISKGADINAKNIIHINLIIIFFIKKILNELRKVNKKNETPLHVAVVYDSIEIIDILISKGADINAKNNQCKYDWSEKRGCKTPLHYATENKSKEIVELLISKGADVNVQDIIYLKI